MNLKFILFIPFVEIMLFILFGDFLGFFPVIFLIIASGLVGIYFLRTDINIENLQNITNKPQDWIYKKIAGLLLIIPGFMTDFIGLFLLIKTLRNIFWGYIPQKTKDYFYTDVKKTRTDEIIDVDYKDLDEK
ncbi:MAG: FxsA family protein [Alphaproteobacteria bacterium]